MDKPRRGEQPSPKGLLARLDHAAAAMNAFLLVLAIGLAMLDFTCFWVIKVREAMPAATRIEASTTAGQKPAPAASHTAAAASPASPAPSTAGF